MRESGISQGALYLYFANKDDIVVALADERHQQEAFLNALAEREQDPIRGLARLIDLHGSGLKDPARADLRRVGIQGWGEDMDLRAVGQVLRDMIAHSLLTPAGLASWNAAAAPANPSRPKKDI